MSELRLNGYPVAGQALLETTDHGRKRILAAITVPYGSRAHQAAREAVLANHLEVTLEGEAHEPLAGLPFAFRATGQLVNGRVGREIKADFKSTTFVKLVEPGEIPG